jgi:two-component system, NarL family, response regulator
MQSDSLPSRKAKTARRNDNNGGEHAMSATVKETSTSTVYSARSNAPITLIIADDHAVVREGLSAMIARQPDLTVVAEAENGVRALALWRAHRPDLLLLDLRMPGLDGVAVIREVRAADPKARIVILTTYDDDEDIYLGMQAGAKAYLLKDIPREELLRCIRAVHAGENCVHPSIAAKLASHMNVHRLTDRELQALAAIAAGASNKEIARALSITEGTVKTHVASILQKLDVSSRTEAVTLAARRGLIKL